MMLFAGIHIPKNGSGKGSIAILDGDELSARLLLCILVSNAQEAVEIINKFARRKGLLVAIDDALAFPKRGARRAEELVSMLFGQYGVNPDKVTAVSVRNRKFRGEQLVDLLDEQGVSHEPRLRPFERSRKCFEVRLDTALVSLFALDEALLIPDKPLASHSRVLSRFQRLLSSLADAHFPFELLRQDVDVLEKDGLGELSLLLQSLFCSYLAYFAWKHPDRCEVIGNRDDGYVLTPVLEKVRDD